MSGRTGGAEIEEAPGILLQWEKGSGLIIHLWDRRVCVCVGGCVTLVVILLI